MLRSSFRLSLLIMVSIGVASLTQAQVSNSPVLLVDNSENQEGCSTDPSLIAYPCFRTIQEAINNAANYTSSFILILPGEYEGFSVSFGKLRSLLIQGFRGIPLIQGRVSLEGSGDWIVVLKNLDLQGQGPLITLGLTGAPIFTRLDGIFADAQGTAVNVREALFLEITNSWFNGSGSGCGLELGGGIIHVSDTTIEGFEKGICDRSAAPANARTLTLGPNVEISYNRGRGVELKALGAEKFGVFITRSRILDNGLDGLYLADVDYGTIAGNTIVGSEQSFRGSSRGLYIRGRGDPVSVESNTIKNFAYGITVDPGPGLIDISYNTISKYQLCGVTNNGRVTGTANIIEDTGAPALCPSPSAFPPGFRR